MRVKRYVADSIPEAITQVKSDLGRNAIILHTKPFKEGGFFGLFCKRRFEVIAAIDENSADYESTRSEKKYDMHPPSQFQATPPAAYPKSAAPPSSPSPSPSLSPIPSLGTPLTSGSPPGSAVATLEPISTPRPELAASSTPELNNIKEELAEVKKLIKQVVATTQSENQPVTQIKPVSFSPALPAASLPAAASLARLIPKPTGIDQRVKWLKQFDLAEELVQHLIETANYSDIRLEDQAAFLAYCHQVLCQSLVCEELMTPAHPERPQVITLIGPTGVGKTTTIAKLAANYNLFEGKKVGLVTIDTYRIAAVEHLKTYGEIINLPVEVVYNQADLERSLTNFQEYDLVLIDTAGRSPHNQSMMEELGLFLSNPALRLIQLVISATTQYRDMIGIVENFAIVPYSHFIFTKLDETSCLGPVISLAWKTGRPISYLTTGQNVPDDIELAKPEKVVERLFKGFQHG